MKCLTERQSKIYEFIAKWHESRGYPPTQGEIRDQFGFGRNNAVRSHLALIEKKGHIRLNCRDLEHSANESSPIRFLGLYRSIVGAELNLCGP